MRASGILLPIASLPSKYGIGAFSSNAYQFVDFLREAGQKYWQILPLGPTSYGDSPYQSFSTFAGNPYFIDLDELVKQGLLTEEECNSYDFGSDERDVDYGLIYESRFKILKKAYLRSGIGNNEVFHEYLKENDFWIRDYGLYMAIKEQFDGHSWIEWDEDIRLRAAAAVARYEEELKAEIEFYQYLQFEFKNQWMALKQYANENGVKIIGDIPIYVAFDSADSWANPALFQFDEESRPIAVAGCPPDGFSATGQLWGNPLYDWEYHEKTGYAWWVQRTRASFQLYDVVRVDHFRGFDEYYSIPAGHDTAEFGIWKQGPGYGLFEVLNRELGDLDFIAEDLGYLTPSVIELVEKTGYPGMKVLEFAFDSREESDYLPHNYTPNCIVYTGTHDNQTLIGWINELSEGDRNYAMEYMNLRTICEGEFHWDFIKLAMQSVARTAIIPMQDYLGLDGEARINFPSTVGGNWTWRLLEEELTEELAHKIARVSRLYGRGK